MKQPHAGFSIFQRVMQLDRNVFIKQNKGDGVQTDHSFMPKVIQNHHVEVNTVIVRHVDYFVVGSLTGVILQCDKLICYFMSD